MTSLSNTRASEEIRFFLPGPTYVREDVRQAMTAQSIGHRSADFKALYGRLSALLPSVFRTSGDVVALTSSGSLAWEVALRSLVRSQVLCLTCGAFSERFRLVATTLGLEVDEVSVPWGQSIDPDLLRQALRRKRYEVVTLAHNETSTGVLNPLAEIAEVVRQESDALILVDGVSSIAGARAETEAWGIDYMFTGAQKALALPPGLAFISASERALQRAAGIEHRGYYTDLVRYVDKHRAGMTVTTPAVPQIRAAEVQLGHIMAEGLEARWQRHLDLRAETEAWAAARGFAYASAATAASPTVSCLRPPAGIEAPALVAKLAEQGITLGGGYGDWKPSTIRIGHMGEVRSKDLSRLFEAIDAAVEELR